MGRRAGATIGPADRADLDLQRQTIQQQVPDADWRARAACADSTDPDLFFPERSQAWKAAKARAVCAGCGVQPACLEFALRAQTSQQDDHGIFAGTSRQQRLRLRGQPPIATPTRFLTDPKAAAEAMALARRVGVIGAAERLGVSREALYHAFDRYGLGRPNGQRGSPPSRFLIDRHHAEQVFQRAREVGITRAAEPATAPSARHGRATAWACPSASGGRRRRHRLTGCFWGCPATRRSPGPSTPPGRRCGRGHDALRSWRRSAPGWCYEAAAENRARPASRVWTLTRRARQALERQAAAAPDPSTSRASRGERLAAAQARRRVARAREVAARADRRTARARTRATRDGERER